MHFDFLHLFCGLNSKTFSECCTILMILHDSTRFFKILQDLSTFVGLYKWYYLPFVDISRFRNFSLWLWHTPHVHAAKVQHMLLLSSYMFSSWGRDSVTRIMGLQLSAASRICHPWNIQSKFHTQVPQNVWTPAINFQESLEATKTSSLNVPIRML